jgi:endoglycosylceramidase
MSCRLGVATALAVVWLALATAAPAGAASPPLSPLHREGESIVDAQGRVVVLHGVNVVWKSPPYYPLDTFGGLTDADLARIAHHGWNVIRLGVIPEGLMPTKGHIDEHYLDEIAATIDRIGAHGLYALLDIHQDLLGLPWGNGFPDWSIHHMPVLESAEPNLGFPLNALRPSHSLAWDAFWSDAKLAPGDSEGPVGYLTESIGALTDRVGHDPAVAGIELINEPWPGTPFVTCAATPTLGCPVVDTYVQTTWQRLTDRIRRSASDLLVWWEPNSTWNETVASALDDPPITPEVTDPEVAFAFHDYCAFGELSTYLHLPSALQIGCDAYHDLTWANAATMRARTGMPQLVTEFGNITDPVELARSLQHSDAALTGWMYWHYGPGRAVSADPGEPFTPGQLQQLVRTYPTATAGTPLAYTFDAATGTMHYAYRPTAKGQTSIAVSDVHYRNGWTASAGGGRITSAAGATPILVTPDPGVTQVNVVVQRAAGPAVTTTSLTSTTSTGSRTRQTLPATGAGPGPIAWVLTAAAAALVALRRRAVPAGS